MLDGLERDWDLGRHGKSFDAGTESLEETATQRGIIAWGGFTDFAWTPSYYPPENAR